MPKGGKREGAGRKPSPTKKVRLSIAVDPTIAQWIKQKAKQLNLSQSRFTEELIMSYVKEDSAD